MIRLLLRLFGIKDFDTCESCAMLKEQLKYEREEKQQLIDTLINIVNPKLVEAAPVEINPTKMSAMTFSRRRDMLEKKSREEAALIAQSKNLGRPDRVDKPIFGQTSNIEEIEKELGINREGA